MKTWRLFFPVFLISMVAVPAQDTYRDWTSKKGKRIKARIVGVEDGKAILEPEVKPYKVAVSSLSEADQKFIKEWEVADAARKKDEEEWRMAKIFSAPLLKHMRGSLFKFDGKALQSYKMESPEKIQYVAIYFNKKSADRPDKAIKELSKAYKQLRGKYASFEMFYYPVDATEDDLLAYLKEYDVTLPVLEFVLARKSMPKEIKAAYAAHPQLVLMDVKGEVLVDSVDRAAKTTNVPGALKEMEKVLREKNRKS